MTTVSKTAKPTGERPSVGAIRWDAWSGGEVTRQVEKTLASIQYQARLPWFAQVDGDRAVRIAGNQETMDREIAFAAGAGLDYWAFLLYPEGNSMSDSLRLYLDSAKRRSISFCLILHNAFGVSEAQWPRERERALALLREPTRSSSTPGTNMTRAGGSARPGCRGALPIPGGWMPSPPAFAAKPRTCVPYSTQPIRSTCHEHKTRESIAALARLQPA